MKLLASSFLVLATAAIVTGRAFKKNKGKGSGVDIGFLIENPGNSRPEGHQLREGKDVFTHSQEFVKDLVKHFNVSVPGIHIGVVTYGDLPFMAFDFNEHLSSKEVEKAMGGLTRPSRGSQTGKALKFVKTQLFEGSARPNARKVLVILATQASRGDAPLIADELKKSGITIYSIAIDGSAVELNDLVSEPIEEHKFITKSDDLGQLTSKITNLIIKDHKVSKEDLVHPQKDFTDNGNEESPLPPNTRNMEAAQDSDEQNTPNQDTEASDKDKKKTVASEDAPKDEEPKSAPRDVVEPKEAPNDNENPQEAPKDEAPKSASSEVAESKEVPSDITTPEEAPKDEAPKFAPSDVAEPKEAPKDIATPQEAPQNEAPNVAPSDSVEPKEAPNDKVAPKEAPQNEETQNVSQEDSEDPKEAPKNIEAQKQGPKVEEPQSDSETPKEAPTNIEAQTGTPEETESPLNGPMESEAPKVAPKGSDASKDVPQEANSTEGAPKNTEAPKEDSPKEAETPKEDDTNGPEAPKTNEPKDEPEPQNVPHDLKALEEAPKSIETPKGLQIAKDPNNIPIVTEAPIDTPNKTPQNSDAPRDAPKAVKDSQTPQIDAKDTEVPVEAPKNPGEHKHHINDGLPKDDATILEPNTIVDNITLDEMPEKKTITKSSKPTPTQKDSEPKMSKDELPKHEKSLEPERLPDPTPQEADPSTATPEMPANEMPKMTNETAHEPIDGEPEKKSSSEPPSDSPAPIPAEHITEEPKQLKVTDAPVEEAPKDNVAPETPKEAPKAEPLKQIKDKTSSQTSQEAPVPFSPPKKDPQEHMSIVEPKAALEEPPSDLPPPDSPPPKKVAAKDATKAPSKLVTKEPSPSSSVSEPVEAPAIQETAIAPAQETPEPEGQMQPSPDATVPEADEGPVAAEPVLQEAPKNPVPDSPAAEKAPVESGPVSAPESEPALQEAPKNPVPDSPAAEKAPVESGPVSTPVSTPKKKVAKPKTANKIKIVKKAQSKDIPKKKRKHKLIQLLTKTALVKPRMPPPGMSGKPNRVDLAFAIQGTGKMNDINWMRTMLLINSIVTSLPVGEDETRVAINMESSRFHLLIPFFKYPRKRILRAITRLMAIQKYIPKPEDFNNLPKALKDTRSLLLQADGRAEVPKVVIIISEKKSPGNVELQARLLRSEGVEVYAIGLGDWYSPRQLEAEASHPIREHVMYGDFTEWEDISHKLIFNIYRKYFDRRHMNSAIRKEVYGE